LSDHSPNHPSAAPRRRRGGYRQLVEELQQRIRRGEWLPGDRLPAIHVLAEGFGVGTGSLREALRALQSLGWVQIEHGRGVFVTGRQVLRGLHDLDATGPGMVLALAETRRILEPELAALAAERGSDGELNEISALAEEMKALVELGADFIGPDLEFHRSIARAAHNRVMARMMDGINDLLLESRRITVAEPGMTARALRYHLLIADAIRSRNASQARLLMLAHMNDALNSVLNAP
jgi:GntR family transcriptional repressor for pyruvate dehydrogenase complex